MSGLWYSMMCSKKIVVPNSCRVLTQWARIPPSSMVAKDLTQFLQPSCILFPKTETGVPQFTPANVLHHFINKGRFHTLTELYLFVILPDFPFHSPMFNCLSPRNILGVSGHHLLLNGIFRACANSEYQTSPQRWGDKAREREQERGYTGYQSREILSSPYIHSGIRVLVIEKLSIMTFQTVICNW